VDGFAAIVKKGGSNHDAAVANTARSRDHFVQNASKQHEDLVMDAAKNYKRGLSDTARKRDAVIQKHTASTMPSIDAVHVKHRAEKNDVSIPHFYNPQNPTGVVLDIASNNTLESLLKSRRFAAERLRRLRRVGGRAASTKRVCFIRLLRRRRHPSVYWRPLYFKQAWRRHVLRITACA
jgi:hypothetical protein